MILGACFGLGILIDILIVILAITILGLIYFISKYTCKRYYGIDIKCNLFKCEFCE